MHRRTSEMGTQPRFPHNDRSTPSELQHARAQNSESRDGRTHDEDESVSSSGKRRLSHSEALLDGGCVRHPRSPFQQSTISQHGRKSTLHAESLNQSLCTGEHLERASIFSDDRPRKNARHQQSWDPIDPEVQIRRNLLKPISTYQELQAAAKDSGRREGTIRCDENISSRGDICDIPPPITRSEYRIVGGATSDFVARTKERRSTTPVPEILTVLSRVTPRNVTTRHIKRPESVGHDCEQSLISPLKLRSLTSVQTRSQVGESDTKPSDKSRISEYPLWQNSRHNASLCSDEERKITGKLPEYVERRRSTPSEKMTDSKKRSSKIFGVESSGFSPRASPRAVRERRISRDEYSDVEPEQTPFPFSKRRSFSPVLSLKRSGDRSNPEVSTERSNNIASYGRRESRETDRHESRRLRDRNDDTGDSHRKLRERESIPDGKNLITKTILQTTKIELGTKESLVKETHSTYS